MSLEVSERSFEEAIEAVLLRYGPDACGGEAAAVREPTPPYGEGTPGGDTESGDLLIGVADDGSIVEIEQDQLEGDDKFLRHLAQVVRNGLGDRASTCIDPKIQIVEGSTVCVVSCQRSPEPVFLKWKGTEVSPQGDFFVRSGPGTVKLAPESAREYIRTRFGEQVKTSDRQEV